MRVWRRRRHAAARPSHERALTLLHFAQCAVTSSGLHGNGHPAATACTVTAGGKQIRTDALYSEIALMTLLLPLLLLLLLLLLFFFLLLLLLLLLLLTFSTLNWYCR